MAVKTVDVHTAKQWLDKGEAVIVDVRELDQHAAQSIVGAMHLPSGQLSAATLPDSGSKKIVLHCNRGGRAGRTCNQLIAEDADLEVYNLEGGITAWAEAGLPVQGSGKSVEPDKFCKIK